jgi:hypothetical protein
VLSSATQCPRAAAACPPLARWGGLPGGVQVMGLLEVPGSRKGRRMEEVLRCA